MKNQNVTYTERISARNRNYFIDLKKASNGNNYVMITESKPNGEEGYDYIKMILFQEDLFRFQTAFDKVVEKFEKSDPKEKSDYIEKVQKVYPNAFTPWSKEDETQLIELFNADSTVEQLSKHFLRTEKSIVARLQKNGLEIGLQAA